MIIFKERSSKNLLYPILTFLFFHAHSAFPIDWSIDSGEDHPRSIKPSELTHFSDTFIPKRFRSIDALECSGSQQYTPEELREIITEKIPHPKEKIIFVDLREELHFMTYPDATASIQSAKAKAYNGLSAPAIGEEEEKFVRSHPFYQTEEECVKKLGALYYRIPVTDATRPEDSDVDRFITFLRGIQGKNYWLHFHCLAGLGRTTTFMAMYEMIRTASFEGTSFEDIIRYQHQIGGANLAFMWYSSSRAQWMSFLQNFYEYSKYGFHRGVSWSQWLEQQHLERFQERPTEVPWCSLSYFCSYAKSVAMMNSMRLIQLRRNLFG
jgi:protein-tyrosine phosphatase